MHPKFTRGVGTGIQAALALFLLVYGLDWAVFHMRRARGGGTRTVQVEQYLSTPLKGNKAEYDYMGTVVQDCAASVFPQGGDTPCWWLERHKTQWQQ